MIRTLATLILLACPTALLADDVAAIRYLERGDTGAVEISTTGAATAQTPFAIASIGKTMTSVAILRMVADGALSLDEPAALRLDPDITAGLGGLEGMSLSHLLTMTSGLPDYLTDDYIEDALADPGQFQTPRAALRHAYGEPPLFRPGGDFDYSNTNYVLLGLILENVSGLSYAGAMKRHVFEPAGMSGAFVFGSAPLPAGFPNGHEAGAHIRSYYEAEGFGDGGVISNATDLAKFYRALFVSRTLLPEAFMQKMKRDPVGEGYGMGIEIEGAIYGHSGGDLGFSSDVRIDAETGDIAIVLIANGNSDTDWAYDVLTDP